MDNSRNKNYGSLGVNEKRKNKKKSSSLQTNNGTIASSSKNGGREKEPPRYKVYRTTVDNFKSLVQQITGSPNHSPHKPLQNSSKPQTQSTKLQNLRPSALSNNQPPASVQVSTTQKAPPPPPFDYNNNSIQFGGPSYQFTQQSLSSSNPLQSGCFVPVTPQEDMSWNIVVDQPHQNSTEDLDAWLMDSFFDPQPQPYYYPNNVDSYPQPYNFPSNVDSYPHQTQVLNNFEQYPSSYDLATACNAAGPLLSENITNPDVFLNGRSSNNEQLVSGGLNGISYPQMNDVPEFLLPSPNGNLPLQLTSPQPPYGSHPPSEMQFPSSPPTFPFTPYIGPNPLEPPLSPSMFYPMSPSEFSPMSPTQIFPVSPREPNP